MEYSIIGQKSYWISLFPVNARFSAGLTLSMTLLLVATMGFCTPVFSFDVNPMVRLEPGFTEQRVTGNILRDEWVKKKDDSGICWEGKLWTFYVFHSIDSPKLSCIKNGIFIPHNAYNIENPKVVIDASCGRETKHPPAIVRIYQPNRPGDLKFDFQAKDVPAEGANQIIRPEHFYISGKTVRSLVTVLSKKGRKDIISFIIVSGNKGVAREPLPTAQSMILNELPRVIARTEPSVLPQKPTTMRRRKQDPVIGGHPIQQLASLPSHDTNNEQRLDPVWKSPSVMTDDFLVFQSRESNAQREAILAQARYKAKLHLLAGRCRHTAQLLALNQKDIVTGASSEALAERISTSSQALEESMAQLSKNIDKAISALSERAGWEAPPLSIVRQRAYIDLQSIATDTEPEFALLQQAMSQAAYTSYIAGNIATSSARRVGAVVPVPLSINQGGMMFCREGKQVMKRLFATGLYSVNMTFKDEKISISSGSKNEVIESNVRLLNDNSATEQLLLPDIGIPERDHAGLLPCEESKNGEWDNFVEADKQLLMIIQNFSAQQEVDRKVYQQRSQFLQERISGLETFRTTWNSLGKRISSERDRLCGQLCGDYTGSRVPISVTTAKLDDHTDVLQKAITETPFTVVVKFNAMQRDIPFIVDEAGRQLVTSQLESLLDVLIGPDALDIVKGAKFIRQELTPIALVALGSGYQGLAKLVYRLELLDPLPLCGDRNFMQRIGLIEMGSTPEGYTTFRDFLTRQEWMVVGMGNKGYGFSLDDAEAFVNLRNDGWRLPKVEEISELRSSDLYRLMKRDIQAVNRPFWTGSTRNAEQRGFCFISCRQRNRTYAEQATEFAAGENLALILLRSTKAGENK